MADGSGQDRFFPWNSVILEKPFAHDEAEMQMKMYQLAARLVIPQKAQNGRVIAAR